MSDGGRERASIGVEVWKSSQKWSVQRTAVRSSAWLDARCCMSFTREYETQSDAEEKQKCHDKNDVHIPRQSRKRIMLGESAGEISCHSGIDKRAKLNNADDR